MQYFRRLVTRFFMVFEKLKGPKTVRAISNPKELFNAHLVGYSASGYQIQIFCEKKVFQQQYARWYIKNKELYHVYSLVTMDAPDSLKRACKLDVTIPPLYPEFYSDSYQKDAAVEAYLDLLIREMEPEDQFNA